MRAGLWGGGVEGVCGGLGSPSNPCTHQLNEFGEQPADLTQLQGAHFLASDFMELDVAPGPILEVAVRVWVGAELLFQRREPN